MTGPASSTRPAASRGPSGTSGPVRRALTLVAVAVGVAVVCSMLGLWQWHRHEDRSAAIAVVEANYEADPVPLDALLASPDAGLSTGDVWRPVRVTGRYDTDRTVLLRNRPVDGRPAFHVLVPFRVAQPSGDDAVLVVDRGTISTDQRAADVPPPEGDVELVVRLRADEPASSRDAPTGQVQAISVAQVLAAGAGVAADAGSTADASAADGADGRSEETPAYDAYGALVSEDPAPADPLGPLPRPSTDPGSHLSYAFQWWTFALGALIGFSVLARRELTSPTDGDGAPPTTPRRRRAPSAEEIEDALIDAQLR
jgi:cytochrome oxidase assembly protein ShyY1